MTNMEKKSNLNVATYTLGCKVNQYDTESLLSHIGKIVPIAVKDFKQVVDIYIINTCTVTHVSDRKSNKIIRRARRLNPSALVAVCGCMVKSSPKAPSTSGADFVFDAREPENFIEYVQKHFNDFLKTVSPVVSLTKSPNKRRTRAFIKIQDGCNRFCSYCIIPYVRGESKSRYIKEILEEAQALVTNGTLEVVITGIQVASFGEDTGEKLSDVITQLSNIKNLQRLRLSSIDPWAINGEFIEAVMTAQPILCEHFHLSLQSGCDATLERMNRKYTIDEYICAASSLMAICPEAALTTDIIVGFPDETDEDFMQCMEIVRALEFAQVHVFEYSPREGTAAVTFPNQISAKVKSERGELMRELAKELRENFLQKQVGKIVSVLFEEKKPNGLWAGFTSNYCPVEIISNKDLTNTIQMVEITGNTQEILQGI